MSSRIVNKFWTVQAIGPGARSPTIIHTMRAQATIEAKRLAEMHPQSVFYVMEAEYGYTRDTNIPEVGAQHITVNIL